MATRRPSDPTRNPKSAAASTTAKPAKAAADSKPKTSEPKATSAPKAVAAKTSGAATAAVAASVAPAPAKRAAKAKASTAAPPPTIARVSEDTRRGMIAESAYLRAERRGFAPGHEHEDWCAAEKEVDALLNANTGAGRQ